MLAYLARVVEWIAQMCCRHEWIERDNWQGRYLQCAKCLRRSEGWHLRDEAGRLIHEEREVPR